MIEYGAGRVDSAWVVIGDGVFVMVKGGRARKKGRLG